MRVQYFVVLRGEWCEALEFFFLIFIFDINRMLECEFYTKGNISHHRRSLFSKCPTPNKTEKGLNFNLGLNAEKL